MCHVPSGSSSSSVSSSLSYVVFNAVVAVETVESRGGRAFAFSSTSPPCSLLLLLLLLLLLVLLLRCS
jgi:hypothetical protein